MDALAKTSSDPAARPAPRAWLSPINQSPQFMLDEQALEVGVRAMLQVAVDYLAAP